jgi:hypothetical protein
MAGEQNSYDFLSLYLSIFDIYLKVINELIKHTKCFKSIIYSFS